MQTCIICGETTNKTKVQAALFHFRLYQCGQWRFLRGNVEAFGMWSGWMGTLGLVFPFFNTIRNWKHRKKSLEFPILPSGGCSL